jgi:predicted metalloprotease
MEGQLKKEPKHSREGRPFAWRLGALFGFVAVAALVALGVTRPAATDRTLSFNPAVDPVTGQRIASAGPKIQTVPLGTEADCVKRVGAGSEEFCSDMFLGIEDLDKYWKEQFPKLATKNQKYASPKSFVAGISPVPGVDCFNKPPQAALAYCGDPAHYAFGNNQVYIAESTLVQYHKRGDFAAVIIMAHEWGHHIQNLLGGLQQVDEDTYTIRFELQADCFAGAYANYEDKALEQLEPGDVDEASTLIYSVGDPRDGSWNDEDAHGQAEQRVLAFRTGYVFGDPRVCNDWGLFVGTDQPLLNLGKYALAITPPDVVEKVDYGYIVRSGETISAIVAPMTKLGTTAADKQFPDIFKKYMGAGGRPLDAYKPEDLPHRGVLPQSEIDKATSFAQTYELTVNGKQVHGIVYLHVRNGGGSGVIIDVFSAGAAGKADWKPLQNELRYLLLGLSIKNGQNFGFTGSGDAKQDGSYGDDDPHASSASDDK